MSKQNQKHTKPSLIKTKSVGSITEYILPANNLRVLYMHIPNTGIITTNIVYRVGARDEERGETGIAHMLEHMLFKPTKHDIKQKRNAESMEFEREVGILLNANTWKDRTSYYFSYPKQYIDRALRIEAERMHDVILIDTEFLPERTNVLSEFDMYAGDEDFILSVQIVGTALHSHPYGHETIGYREDIEAYTTGKLEKFYKKYYAPNNATLIITGDISEKNMKKTVCTHFAHLKPSGTFTPRIQITEPKQEGMRLVTIKRPSTKNILALGIRHEGFPQKAWFETMVACEILAGDDDSIFHKKLIDTGYASSLSVTIEPTYDNNIGILSINLTEKCTHHEMYKKIRTILSTLTEKDIAPYLKKIIAKQITAEFITRSSSLGITQELVEYVSAHAWEHFFKTEPILRDITPKDILTRIHVLFAEEQLTIGHFIGTKK